MSKNKSGLVVGVCGLGFGVPFAKLFKAHPAVEEVIIVDVSAEKREQCQREMGVRRAFSSFEEVVASDVDAIAIFTPPWLHAQQTLEALSNGKKVFCACPAALTVKDMTSIINTVRETELTYMTAETSYYYPQTVFCRNKYQKGDFGELVYAHAEYYYYPHSYNFWMRDNYANFPPMLYASHSTANIIGAVGSRFTAVSCLGMTAIHPDAVDKKRLPEYATDTFANETALMRMGNGAAARINEFRRVAANSETSSIYGTEGALEQAGSRVFWRQGRQCEDMTSILLQPYQDNSALPEMHPHALLDSMIPPALHFGRGHLGSHRFLVHEFVRSCVEGLMPLNNAWMAARYCLPGIIAHESAKQEGKWLDIPDLGEPPQQKSFEF